MMILARSTKRASAVRLRDSFPMALSSSSLQTRGGSLRHGFLINAGDTTTYRLSGK
jgi:hypothetical protein